MLPIRLTDAPARRNLEPAPRTCGESDRVVLKSLDCHLQEAKSAFHFGQPGPRCPAWLIQGAGRGRMALNAASYPSRLGDVPHSRQVFMNIKPDILAAIGNTPLIKLRRASEMTGCTILGKAEFLNPGQSVKDRAALFIVEDAVRRGLLRPGGIIVEGTAGNTGIGLALVANVLGYRTMIVIPETQSQEKKDMLRLAGAELIEVPAVPYANPNNYVKISGRLAERLATSES